MMQELKTFNTGNVALFLLCEIQHILYIAKVKIDINKVSEALSLLF